MTNVSIPHRYRNRLMPVNRRNVKKIVSIPHRYRNHSIEDKEIKMVHVVAFQFLIGTVIRNDRL